MRKFTYEIGEFNDHDSSGVYFQVESSDGIPVLAVYPANGVGDGEGWNLDVTELRELVGKLQEAGDLGGSSMSTALVIHLAAFSVQLLALIIMIASR